jgi:MIP family channel proteins
MLYAADKLRRRDVHMDAILAPIMLRRYLAEFLGTFAYVFFGCGARIMLVNAGFVGYFMIYLTFGLTLVVMTYALSHISGAPFNPAITLGLAVMRRFPWRYLLPYWVAQFAGALLASALHLALLSNLAVAARFGATFPTVGLIKAVVIEAIMTFFLMLVVMSTATDPRVNRAAKGIAMGFTITLCGIFAGLLTGGSMNPARSLAPALFAGGKALSEAWVYLLGPALGAISGALIYEFMRGGPEHVRDLIEDIIPGIEDKKKRSKQARTDQGSVDRPL